MLAVQPPEEQNSTAPAGEEASPLEEAAVIIFSPPEYNYFELGPWEDIAGCWNSWPNATWSCPDPFCFDYLRGQSERNRICDALAPVFDYLESRITGTCEPQYNCADMYEICRVVRAFNPNFADVHVDPAFVDAMAAIKPLVGFGLLAG